MSKKLIQEIRRGRRYNHPLSLIFGDIDYFKRVNDTYGHQAGDIVLKEFVTRIYEQIRADVDWVTRYGGEEFLIVLPETNLEGATCFAERIRDTISGREIKFGDIIIRITASFGVTGIDNSTPEHLASPEAMIQHVDKNLYRSKNEGRNKTTASMLL
jgi:two-component system cell cycle response regulator